MPALDLAFFTDVRDPEASRYRVLGGLQTVRRAFCCNRVYPHLADLIHLRAALCSLAEESAALRPRGPLSGLDMETGTLHYDAPDDAILPFEGTLAWALPLIEEAIEEGRAIYDFVDERTDVEVVGIVPKYQDEGYLLIPEGDTLRVLRYAVSLFTRHDERYRSLRTSTEDAVPQGATPHEIKQFLAAHRSDLPNPATYYVATDLDFPVDETMVPVAKRKLLQYLAFGGSAGAC